MSGTPKLAVFFFLTLGFFMLVQAEGTGAPLPIKGLEPASTEVLKARDSGTVEELAVEIGSEVKAGDILMKLDHERQLTAYLAAKLRAESRSGIEVAEGVLREKNAALNIAAYRFRRRQVPEEEVEKAQGQAQVARGQLEAAHLARDIAKLELSLADKLLERRYVRTPIAGTVTAMAMAIGSRANAGDVVLTVSDLSSVSTRISVTEASLKVLKAGGSIPVRVAGSDLLHSATIAEISPLEGGTHGEQSVRLLFDNLLPGQAPGEQSAEVLLPDGAEVVPAKPQPPKKK